LPLPASLLVVSGALRASPVDLGRAQGAGHRIGSRRTENRLWDAAENGKISDASQISSGIALEDATRLEMLLVPA
jgi:hypothetical protein